jgi:hypothetical protein
MAALWPSRAKQATTLYVVTLVNASSEPMMRLLLSLA